MKYAIWQSVNFGDCAFGYSTGALMKQVWEGRTSDLIPDEDLFQEDVPVSQLLDRIWAAFQWVNDDHRPPEGYEGRSLSIGDVVHLIAEDGEGHQVWFTPGDPTGWVPIDPIENMACPDCDGEWADVGQPCPKCGLTHEKIAERLAERGIRIQ